MRANDSNAEELFKTDDIVHGFGEVQAIRTEHGLGWLLPGRIVTYCRDTAEHQAKRLDTLIQSNMKRYDRALIW